MSTDRERLAAALKPLIRYSPTRTAVVAALLPVVDRIATERAAAELRAAADDMPGKPGTNPAQDWLLARADALDPS